MELDREGERREERKAEDKQSDGMRNGRVVRRSLIERVQGERRRRVRLTPSPLPLINIGDRCQGEINKAFGDSGRQGRFLRVPRRL